MSSDEGILPSVLPSLLESAGSYWAFQYLEMMLADIQGYWNTQEATEVNSQFCQGDLFAGRLEAFDGGSSAPRLGVF